MISPLSDVGAIVTLNCAFDIALTAAFECTKLGNETLFKPSFNCIKTHNTEAIEDLAAQVG